VASQRHPASQLASKQAPLAGCADPPTQASNKQQSPNRSAANSCRLTRGSSLTISMRGPRNIANERSARPVEAMPPLRAAGRTILSAAPRMSLLTI